MTQLSKLRFDGKFFTGPAQEGKDKWALSNCPRSADLHFQLRSSKQLWPLHLDPEQCDNMARDLLALEEIVQLYETREEGDDETITYFSTRHGVDETNQLEWLWDPKEDEERVYVTLHSGPHTVAAYWHWRELYALSAAVTYWMVQKAVRFNEHREQVIKNDPSIN